jgi:hypothetical protein
MMTTMTTPQSGDIAARRDRLAQASRLIRSAQSLAEKIAELTKDELARIWAERGDMVPGAIAADTTIARRLLLPCRDLPVELTVFTEVGEGTFDVLDTGKRRSAADVLAIDGEKSSTMLAAMVRTVWLYENRPELNWSGGAARH